MAFKQTNQLYFSQPMEHYSDTEMDDSDNDPDYKPDGDVSSDSDSSDTEQANHGKYAFICWAILKCC